MTTSQKPNPDFADARNLLRSTYFPRMTPSTSNAAILWCRMACSSSAFSSSFVDETPFTGLSWGRVLQRRAGPPVAAAGRAPRSRRSGQLEVEALGTGDGGETEMGERCAGAGVFDARPGELGVEVVAPI